MLKLPRSMVREMIAHSLEEDPIECCGIIGGRAGLAERLIRTRNAENSKFRFSVDGKELLKIYEQFEQENLDVHVIYHSHTGTRAYPSPTDVRFAALWPMVHFVVISLANVTRPVVKSFQIEAGKIKPERLRVLPEADDEETLGTEGKRT